MADACDINNANVKAFLKLIRYAEFYPDESDDFYLRIYGGGRFTDPSKHPDVAVKKWGHTSNAAGAYQFVYSTWAEAKRHGVVTDFSPASQDTLAFRRIEFRGAQEAVCSGDVASASALLASEWTSLPGASQSRMTLDTGQAAFKRYGGSNR